MNPAVTGPGRSTIDRCLDEFDDLWDRGQKPRADNFRQRFDSHDRDDFVELIYQEFCRAEADGLAPATADFLERYAEFRPALERLFAVHFGLEAGPDSPEPVRPDTATLDQFPNPGDQIGPYRLTRILGQGGMGRVFLAEQTDLSDRTVVVKIVRIGSSIEPEHQARVDHPNVMPVYRHFRTENGQFLAIVMPHVPGLSVDKLLGHIRVLPDVASKRREQALAECEAASGQDAESPRRGADLDECIARLRQLRYGRRSSAHWNRQVAVWGARLAKALHAAFQRGIVHGDVKPGNIHISVDFQPYLLDFHLSRRWKFDRHAAVFEQDDPGGTLPYMPPERLENLANRLAHIRVDPRGPRPERARHAHRGDLYSLALVLLELLTGNAPPSVDPFEPGRLGEMARNLAETRRATGWLRNYPGFARLPAEWRAFLERALAADPALRHADGTEFSAEIESLARDRGRTGSLRKLAKSRSLRSGALVCLSLLSVTYLWLVQADRKRETRIAQMAWQTPYEFWDDPSSTQERTISSRIVSSRADFDRMAGLVAAERNSTPATLALLTHNQNVDIDLWLADRVENLSRLLAQRALRTSNARDADVALGLVEYGIRQWPTPTWLARRRKLASKFGRKTAGAIPAKEPAPLIAEYVALIAHEAPNRRDETRGWESLVREWPGSFAVRWGFARELAAWGRSREASRELTKALEIAPGHFEARRLLAQMRFRDRVFESALKDIEIALAQRHDDLSALRIRSILRLYVGQREELKDEIQRMGEILNMEDGSELASERPGDAAEVDPKFETSPSIEILDTRTVERMHEMFPRDRDVTTLLVKKYYRTKRFAEAIDLMERISKSGPRTTQDLINLAILYRNDSRTRKAVETGIELIRRDDLGDWLSRKATRIICFLTIQEVEKQNPNEAVNLCRSMLRSHDRISNGKGFWNYQIARILMSNEGLCAIDLVIEQLISAGNQHIEYLNRWYANEPVFDEFRPRIDSELKLHFPNLYRQTDPMNSRRIIPDSP